jgi:hypothetical protein
VQPLEEWGVVAHYDYLTESEKAAITQPTLT